MSDFVFWDASAFVALGNNRDNLHQAAVAISHQLAQAEAQILTTSAVLTEVANIFSKVKWRNIGERLIEATNASVDAGVAKVVHVDPSLWGRGCELYKSRPDKGWGLTDCISFVVMKEYRVTQAFTHDHHFEQAGFIRLLTG